jgi:pyroglutamyl-peptidase
MPPRGFIYQLPPDTRATNGEYIEIFPMDKPLQESTTTKYREWLAVTAEQVKQWSPDLVVHVRLDVNDGAGVFKLARAAPKEGCHHIPDADRKAFTRAGYKKVFSKPAASLNTNLDIDSVFEIWQTTCSSLTSSAAMDSSMKNGTLEFKYTRAVDVKLSDDPRSYTCGY